MLCNKPLDIFELEKRRIQSMALLGVTRGSPDEIANQLRSYFDTVGELLSAVAFCLSVQKIKPKEVALFVGVAHQTVLRWCRVAAQGGLDAIRAKRRGRQPSQRLLSDDNPDQDGLGGVYDFDSDPRYAHDRHPVEDIEPEAISPHRAAADKMRSGMAWLVGNRWNPSAIARRSYAAALVLSGGLFDDTRIERLARKMNVTKQALSKNMSEFRDLILDDIQLPIPNLRSQKAREAMSKAAIKSHMKRKLNETPTN